MTAGIVDTNILIELYRNNRTAVAWSSAQTEMAITSISWLEFMEGVRGKVGQARCLQILEPFDLLPLTEDDQHWAMDQLLHYRLSHGVSFKDCLIASATYRLQIPLYTQNVKDFRAILPKRLVIKPY